jgi:hypothetical protein
MTHSHRVQTVLRPEWVGPAEAQCATQFHAMKRSATQGILIDSIRSRYYGARKRDKSRILDELVAFTGHQRKYASRLLDESQFAKSECCEFVCRKIYDGAVKEVLVTLSRAGDCYDNAFMESCFGTIKTELEMTEYRNYEEGRKDIRSYISYYNFERKHSSIGYQAPFQFETNFSLN